MAKILLVEDDNNLREIYEARLQAEGYQIVSAHDGEEALVVAKNEKPDLIISDVMMPKISGFEMLDILRNTEGLKEVKVIMLTALGQTDDQQRPNKLGADRYLVKSQVTLEDIVKVTQEILNPNAPVPADAAMVSAPTPVAESAPDAAPEEPAAAPAEAVMPPPSEPVETPAAEPEAPAATDVPATPTVTPITVTSDESETSSDPEPATPADQASNDQTMDSAINNLSTDAIPTEPSIVAQAQSTDTTPPAFDPSTSTPPVDGDTPAVAADTAAPAADATNDADTESDEISKMESQIQDFANTPASDPDEIPASDTAPSPESTSEPASDSPAIGSTSVGLPTPPTASDVDEAPAGAAATTESTEDSETPPIPPPSTGGVKVITPIDNGEAKPDINELLAKEEAKDNGGLSPNPTEDVAQPASSSPESEVDPNTVAL